MKQIHLIGAGAIGSAIHHILKDHSDIEMVVYDTDPVKLSDARPLSETLPHSGMLFFCVPSWHLAEAATSVGDLLAPETRIIALSKGFETESAKPAYEFLKMRLPENPVGALQGPMLAGEITAGNDAFATIASIDQFLIDETTALFSGTKLHLEGSQDVIGVAYAGITKNVYAIGAGILSAEGRGMNALGSYLAAAAREMEALVSSVGGDINTVRGIAGLADLCATSMSEQSRNVRVGVQIAAEGRITLQSEGLHSLPILAALCEAQGLDLPLLAALGEIVRGAKEPDVLLKVLQGLMD